MASSNEVMNPFRHRLLSESQPHTNRVSVSMWKKYLSTHSDEHSISVQGSSVGAVEGTRVGAAVGVEDDGESVGDMDGCADGVDTVGDNV